MMNVPQKPPRRIEVFCGEDNKWRWRLAVSRGGKVLATSTEGWDDPAPAQAAARTEASFYATAYVTVTTLPKGAPQACPTPA